MLFSRILIFALVVCVLTSCASGDTAGINERQLKAEVLAKFESLVNSVKSLDSTSYFNHFDPENYTSLNANGTITLSFSEFKSDYLNGINSIAAYESLVFNNVKVTIVTPNVATLVNEYVAELRFKDGSAGRLSGAGNQVWNKRGDTWLLVSVSNSTAP